MVWRPSRGRGRARYFVWGDVRCAYVCCTTCKSVCVPVLYVASRGYVLLVLINIILYYICCLQHNTRIWETKASATSSTRGEGDRPCRGRVWRDISCGMTYDVHMPAAQHVSLCVLVLHVASRGYARSRCRQMDKRARQPTENRAEVDWLPGERTEKVGAPHCRVSAMFLV